LSLMRLNICGKVVTATSIHKRVVCYRIMTSSDHGVY
jgi:hypothetical protein